MSKLLDSFGIPQMPWVMRVYLLLFAGTTLLILLPGLTFLSLPDDTVREITAIGKDTMKVVVGAVIGSLSMAANNIWGGAEARQDRSQGCR